MKKTLLWLASVLLLGACKPDVAEKSWTTDVLAPLLTSDLTMSNVVGDTLLSTNNDGLLSLTKRVEVFRFGLRDLIEPLNTTLENTVKLGTIDLGTRRISQAVTLGLVARNLGIQGVPILLAHGNSAPVPAVTGVPPFNFPVNANQYFTTMTLQDGWMVLSFHNDFPIPINNLGYSLENSSGGAPILSGYVPSLPPGATAKDSVQLVGVTVSGNLLAKITSMDSPGSGGAAVPIDTNDAITVGITIRDLVPTSATAVFPTQEVINDTDQVVFSDDMELASIVVDSGRLVMDAISTVEDELQFQYLIPEAYSPTGQSFNLEEPVLAAPAFGFATTTVSKSIAGYAIDMTYNGPSGLQYSTFDAIVRGRIDSSGNLINLSLQDSLYLITGVRNMWPKKAVGYLGRDTSLLPNEVVPTALLEELQAGTFDLQQARINLEVVNHIGAPFSFIINSLEARRTGLSPRSLSWNSLGQVLSAGPAQDNAAQLLAVPSMSSFALTETNSNIDQLLEMRPQEMEFDLEVRFNPVAAPQYTNFIYSQQDLIAYLGIDIPLHLSASGLQLADTAAFSYASIDPSNKIIQGNFKLIARNTFPLECVVDLILLDENNQVVHTLVAGGSIDAAELSSNGMVQTEKKSTLVFPFTASDLDAIKGASKLVFLSTYSTRPDGTPVKLYEHYRTRLTLVGDFEYLTP